MACFRRFGHLSTCLRHTPVSAHTFSNASGSIIVLFGLLTYTRRGGCKAQARASAERHRSPPRTQHTVCSPRSRSFPLPSFARDVAEGKAQISAVPVFSFCTISCHSGGGTKSPKNVKKWFSMQTRNVLKQGYRGVFLTLILVQFVEQVG